MRLNRLLLQAYLTRGGRLWLVTRAMLSAVFFLADVDPIHLSVPAAIEVVVLSVVVCFVDTYRNRERALLANMGVRPLAIASVFAAPAVVGEIALRAIGALFL
jgi:hypothetical protein